MKIGGLQKNSFIDYPGKISCVIFLSGCNFDCPYCHNPELARGIAAQGHFLPPDAIYSFLAERKDFLDGVVISGGEPTLQDDLPDFCENIKAMGYPLKLDTNGSRPQIIERLIDNSLVDYVAMDIKTDPQSYADLIMKHDPIDAIPASIGHVMESGIPYEFRTTCVKPIVSAQIVASIARLIRGAMLFVLQRFNDQRVLYPEFFKGSVNSFSNDELLGLKALCEPVVQKCIIR